MKKIKLAKNILALALAFPPVSAFAYHFDIDPNSAVLKHYERGYRYYMDGNYETAITEYTKAIKINPKNARLYDSRADSYFFKGDSDKAIADSTKAIALDPERKRAYTYRRRGDAHLLKGNCKAAIADYDKALELHSKYDAIERAQTYSARGDAHLLKGDYEAAISDYGKALGYEEKHSVEHVTIYEKRAEAYEKKGDPDKAKADRRKAAPHIKTSEKMNWEFLRVNYVFDGGSTVVDFGDMDTKKVYRLKFLNDWAKKDRSPRADGQVVELSHRTGKGELPVTDIVAPKGKQEATLLKLLERALARTTHEVEREIIANCIDVLRNRNQPWGKVKGKFQETYQQLYKSKKSYMNEKERTWDKYYKAPKRNTR